MEDRDLLARIEDYYDAVPRSAARAEDLFPFVLFAQQGDGWPYYARPQLGAEPFTPADVSRVRARQRALSLPESFEWVAETSPGLLAAATAAGLQVTQHPLMVLAERAAAEVSPLPGLDIRLVAPQDDLALPGTIARVGFSYPGTARAEAGGEEVARMVAERRPEQDAFGRERLAAGLTVTAIASLDGDPAAVGSHQPVGVVTEVVGVATLPAFRRRGIGGALTAFLVRDALERGVRTVFLSAGDDDVARVYERVGFRRIGTACIAEPRGKDSSTS